MNYRALVIAVVIAFLAGGYIGDELRPKPDRPVLRFLAKAAKTFLWIMVFEEPPQPQPPYKAAALDADQIDHARSL